MTLLTNNQSVSREPGESFAIRLTEITFLRYPEDDYDYRVRVRSHDESGGVLAEQLLQTRRRPDWLVNVRQPGNGPLSLTLQARQHAAPRWQEIGEVVIHPREHLNGQSSALAVVPLWDWAEAPHLQVCVRLAKDRIDQPRGAALVVAPAAPASEPTGPVAKPTGHLVDAEPAPAPLTAAEQVIVKDVWNKFLAFQDLLIELFFERLLHEEPELVDQFGDAVEVVPGYFAQFFDLSVRRLMPHTERVLRESYRGVHPAPPEGGQTAEECAALLADLGMRPEHWLTARRVWTWVVSEVPYLEEYDRENLAKGVYSAPYRFFTLLVLPPALAAAQQYAEALTPEMIRGMRRGADVLAADARPAGVDFYRILFQTHPDIVPHFGRTDVDSLSEHLMQTVAFLIRSLEAGRTITAELRELSRKHTNASVPAEAYPKLIGPMLAVMKRRIPGFTPEQEHAWAVLLRRVSNVLKQPMLNQQRVLRQAEEFMGMVADELTWEPADRQRRWEEIEREVRTTGTYTHTYEELAYGAQVAWRNSAKCIGRIAWRTLIVRDLRHVTDPDAIFQECTEHLRMATNGGNLQSVINVFRPKKPGERWGPRIWNSQYIRFAAYEQEDGTILGDGANRALTQALIRQGWTPPAVKTPYDCLPLVIDVPGQPPRMYPLAPDDVRMVSIEHPQYPKLAELDLQWCAVPAIANFRMNIGGIHYGCVPFNGWFMETEIARDLWEEGRYNRAEAIAQALGLDTSSEQTLWRDRAFLELNVAILHSFAKAKVTLVDHQTAARQFMNHDLREKRAGRECPAQWSWVVPSSGGSTTSVWHHEMRDFFLSPSYHYAADKWAVVNAEISIPGESVPVPTAGTTHPVPARSAPRGCPFHNRQTPADSRPDGVLILYGSETGTAESYARQTARRLSRHHPRVLTLDECAMTTLAQERLVLIITSTFGNGELPGNAKRFLAGLLDQPDGSLSRLGFSVMALGSTVYPHFCAAGATLDRELARVGGHRVVSLHRGDEVKGQADTFRQWLELVARLLGEDPTRMDVSMDEPHLRVSWLSADAVPTPARQAQRGRLPGLTVPVLANRELLTEVLPGSRSTRFLSFDLTGTDVTYETGDHVAIYPHNPPALVQRIGDRLGVDLNAWFTATFVNRTGGTTGGSHPYAEPTSVRQVLTEELDLALREPFNEIIDALLKTARSRHDRERLDAWRETLGRVEQDEAARTLKQSITEQFATVADLLDAFPSATLSFAQLIDLLPKQKPRLYSIASCPLVYPHQIHVTVGVLHVTTGGTGPARPGLCSNYLAGLDPEQGATVRLAVRTSTFHPPRSPQTPLLLVGPGTGLSPLMGFLQHREAQVRILREANEMAPASEGAPAPLPVRPGYARLYFGCRNWNDYLYQPELETWHRTGVLTHLFVAFSRLGPERTYVQHLMEQHGPAVWKILQMPDCHVYVCGDAQMADGVLAVLLRVARTHGGLSHADAVNFLRTMQSQNRLMMDVWGVLLHFPNALAEVQEAKYTQGERWLERLTVE